MAYLDKLAEANADVLELLGRGEVGHTEVAKRINLSGVSERKVDEKAVRRYRDSKNLGLAQLARPDATGTQLDVRAPRRDATIPTWTPGIEYDRNGGEFRTKPVITSDASLHVVEPEEAELLQQFDLDPAVWEVTGARKSMWQNAAGDWLMAQKVSFKRRAAATSLSAESVEEIMSRYTSPAKRKKYKDPTPGIESLVVPAGDLQLGKQEGGGTAATIDRFGKITSDIADYIQQRGGVRNLVLPWLGDCIEGIVSQNGRMLTTLDISLTEQVRVYRRLMMHQLGTLSPLAERVLLATVPGNHDETTRMQKMPLSDSWAIEGASAVQDWALDRPGYEHVDFVYPDHDSATITVDINGQVLSFTHGHTTGTNPARVVDWWKGQSHGRQLPGQADILVSAHWHHLRVLQTGGNRTWIQIPALDGGSGWFRDKTGDDIASGIASLELGPGSATGWSNLTIWG